MIAIRAQQTLVEMIHRDLSAGRMTLREAVELLEPIVDELPLQKARCCFKGDSVREQLSRLVFHWAETCLEDDMSDEAKQVLLQLRSELECDYSPAEPPAIDEE